MNARSASSLVQAIFFCAAAVAYLGLAAGVLGFVKTSSATLLILIGCAVGCVAGLTFFLISRREFRAPPRHRVTPAQ
jgi:hypothetical protein